MVSKVGSKAPALHIAMKRGYNLLCSLRTNMNNIYCRDVFSVMSHYKRHYTFFDELHDESFMENDPTSI